MSIKPDFKIDIKKNFKILKNICEGKDERKRIKAANWMAQNIYRPDIYYLLEKLANENYYCKMQALLIISKIRTPDKKILSILNSLLEDPEYLISMEASKVLSNNIESGNKDLELAKKLLNGGHEAKIRALEIYKNCWKDETKNILSDLNKLIIQERNNFPIFIKIISLLGFIGKKYSKDVIKLFLRIIFDAEISEKKYIFNALSNFAKENPFEVLSFLSYVEENGDTNLKRNIPEILSLTVDTHPDISFKLLEKLAKDKSRFIRYAVLDSISCFKDVYPEETLKILFYLWINSDRNLENINEDNKLHINQIKKLFEKLGRKRPEIAISFCIKLNNCIEVEKRKEALEIASSLASLAPEKFFTFLEIFIFDQNYQIKSDSIDLFKGNWNIFPIKTIDLLIKIEEKEIFILKKEIENIFSSSKKHNPNKVILNLVSIFNGNIAKILDKTNDCALKIKLNTENIPNKLVVNGEKKIMAELYEFLKRKKIQNWEESMDYLEKFSIHSMIPLRIISLKILPLFLSKNLEIIWEILERLIKDQVKIVREETFELIKSFIEQFPQESYFILEKNQNCQNKYVRRDIVIWITFFRHIFPRKSFQILKKYSLDPDAEVRKEVANNLINYFKFYPEEILNIAGKLCKDTDEVVVKITFDFLEQILDDDDDNVLNLIQALYKDCNGPIREKIALFLGKFSKKNLKIIIGILKDLAKDEIGSVRSCAFSSLDTIGKLEPNETYKILMTLSSENNFDIRRNAIRSLGILGESYSFDLSFFTKFLKDEVSPVKIELAFALGKIGKSNPRITTKIYKILLGNAKDEFELNEAIAESMKTYGSYCPYEAFKILNYLKKSKSEEVLKSVNSSMHILKNKLINFSFITEYFSEKEYSKIDLKHLKNITNIISKKIIYNENNTYSKKIAKQYQLYTNLLKFSTISRINESENLISSHLKKYKIIDEKINNGLINLKKIAKTLGKQNIYSNRDDKIENIKNCLELLDNAERIFQNEFKEFDNPDKFILQSIIHAWHNIISIEFIKLRGSAELKIKLESNTIRKRKKTILRLKLTNEGTSKAENIIASIAPSKEIIILEPTDKNIKILSPNNSEILEFFIRVRNQKESIRIAFSIIFDDAEKREKNINFADQIRFIDTDTNYFEIKNPYIPGKPLRTPEMFYGRNELLENIEKTFSISNRTHILILHGQRRTGKTSILYQLKIRLKENFIPVLLDFQGLADPGTDSLLFWMANEIRKEFKKRKIEIAEPNLNQFQKKPTLFFQEFFFSEIQEKINKQKIILMMDEFELIDDKINEGAIDKNILNYFRNLMQHSSNIEFIFSGTHRLEEMSSNYWSILFNIGLYYHISFLKKDEAEKLICDPVRSSLQFDSMAVDKILEMTAGHPYFIQLVCYYLVEYQKKKKRNYATIEDVNDVLDEVVIGGTPHFQYIWDRLTRIERIILLTLARILKSQNSSSIDDIMKYLQDYHFEVSKSTIVEILQKHLTNGTLKEKMLNNFQFKVKLIQFWLEKTKKLHEIMEEETYG